MTGHENETMTSPQGFSESPQGTKRKRYVGSPRRFGGGHHSSNYSGGKNYPDTPSAPQGKRRPESQRFYPSCLTGEAPEIRNSAIRKVVEKETDMHKVQQRQKQVDYGKNTLGYERYCQQVKKGERRHGVHPSTPDATVRMSNRRFNGLVRAWRRTLHMYDPNPEAAMDDGPTQTPRMPKPGACATPASEARTDTSCGSGARLGGKVIFSPGEEDEDDDDLNFLNNDDAPLPPMRPEEPHAPTTDDAQESRTDEEGEEEGEEDKEIRFMDVDAADESDDDML